MIRLKDRGILFLLLAVSLAIIYEPSKTQITYLAFLIWPPISYLATNDPLYNDSIVNDFCELNSDVYAINSYFNFALGSIGFN